MIRDDVSKQCRLCPFVTRALCVLSGVGCMYVGARCPVCGARLLAGYPQGAAEG